MENEGRKEIKENVFWILYCDGELIINMDEDIYKRVKRITLTNDECFEFKRFIKEDKDAETEEE